MVANLGATKGNKGLAMTLKFPPHNEHKEGGRYGKAKQTHKPQAVVSGKWGKVLYAPNALVTAGAARIQQLGRRCRREAIRKKGVGRGGRRERRKEGMVVEEWGGEGLQLALLQQQAQRKALTSFPPPPTPPPLHGSR